MYLLFNKISKCVHGASHTICLHVHIACTGALTNV